MASAEPRSIAIDGPVASGKTAVGRLVAQRLGWRFLDTGWMYRAVTLAAVDRGIAPSESDAVASLAASVEMSLEAGEDGDRLKVDGEDVTDHLRDQQVGRSVSVVSAIPGVRSAMVPLQRAIAREGPIVMVGRDIGTVVIPDASAKFFLTASAEVRINRRHQELADRGLDPGYARVAEELMQRDRIDSERDDSPLLPAKDAVLIETDSLNVEQVAERILTLVLRR